MNSGRGAISNTSLLQYLHRIGKIEWLAQIFDDLLVPSAVQRELDEGHRLGYDVPELAQYVWMQIVEPQQQLPTEVASGLGPGESGAIMLGQVQPERIVLLDDGLARRVAREMGLQVWGTLRVLLEAKTFGLTDEIAPLVSRLLYRG